MSLWICPEHGLYGGDVFCPKCGGTGSYASLVPGCQATSPTTPATALPIAGDVVAPATTMRPDMDNGHILTLAEEARKASVAQATAFVIDYGGGAQPTLTFEEPSEQICGALARTGGGYELLYTAESVEKMIIHVARSIETSAADELELLQAAVARLGEPTETMIEAGVAVLETVRDDLRKYVSGETTDWDFEMEAEAVFRAMAAAW